MYRNIYNNTEENISLAAQSIKDGKLVAFPTETVYGLGANAFDAKAVAAIFAAKNRPSFNPLISHIAEIETIREFAQTDERVFSLAQKFWPGPLTFVLKRQEHNTALDMACAGLETMSIRMPDHNIALELIKKSGVPIVAPSANKSQTISPTKAEHVAESLGNKVDMILDGGACKVGVESTIIDLTGSKIVLLRAGGISVEHLEEFLNEKILLSQGDPNLPSSPGQMLKHYAPNHPLRINATSKQENEFLIGFGNCKADLNLSPSADLCEAAGNLYAYLRLADKMAKEKNLAISPIPNIGLGLAINDRIKRAAYKE